MKILRTLATRAVTWCRGLPRPRLIATALLAAAWLTLGVFLLDTGSDWRDAWPDDLEPWKNPKLDVLVQAGLWWGGLAAFLITSALLATSGHWMRPAAVRNPTPAPRLPATTFWLPVLAAMVLGGALAAPRLGLSLHGDELYNLRRYIMGSHELDKQLRPEFKPTEWRDAFFENRGADNHVPMTIASKVSLHAWQALSGTDDRHFHEPAMRLPALAAGMLAIGAVAVFLGVAGYPGAGVAGALLAATHPWLIRFGTEATGYILAALWIPLVCASALLAVQTGRWRWWLALAAGQFLMLWSVLGAGFFAVPLNLGILATLVTRARDPNAPDHQIRRHLATLGVTVIPLCLLLGPSLPQILRYLVVDRVDQPMGWPWILNAWSHLAAGQPWAGAGFDNPLILTIRNQLEAGDSLPWILAAVVLPGAVAAGILRLLLSRRPGTAAVTLALAAGAPVLLALATAADSFLLNRYVFFALPGVIAFAALGFTWPAALLARRTPAPLAALPALAPIALFLLATHPQREVIRFHAKENLLGVARAIHGDRDPITVTSEDVLRGHVWSSVSHYDPWSRNTPFDTDLLALMREALDRDIPLYYSFGYRDRAMTEAPVKAAVELAENPLLFDPVATFPGLDQDQFTHRLFRFRGPLAKPHLPGKSATRNKDAGP